MNRILFIDNSTDHSLYKPFEHWKPLLFDPVEVFHAPFDKREPDLDKYSHIILSGSLSSTLENKPWMLFEEEIIRKAVYQGKVVLGNCFGHQLIAKAFFGEKAVSVRDYPEIGWPAMKIVNDCQLLGDAGEIIFGFVLHFDEVCHLPGDQAEVLLVSVECDNLAFKFKNCPVWGIQPHFEIGIAQGLAVIEQVSGPGIPDRRVFLDNDQYGPRDSGRIAKIIREFTNTRPLKGCSL